MPEKPNQSCPQCGGHIMPLGTPQNHFYVCTAGHGCDWTSRSAKPPEKPKPTAVPTCPECGGPIGLVSTGSTKLFACMDGHACGWSSRPVDATANPVDPPEKPADADADEPVRLSEVERDVAWAFGCTEALGGNVIEERDRTARFFRLAKRDHKQAKRDRAALYRAREILRMVVECDRINDVHGRGKADAIFRTVARQARVELGLSLNSKPDATPPIARGDVVPVTLERMPAPIAAELHACGWRMPEKSTPDLFAPTPG